MGQVCSTVEAVHASTPTETAPKAQQKHEQVGYPPEVSPAHASPTKNNTTQSCSSCRSTRDDETEPRRSTGDKRVSILPIASTLSSDGVSGTTAVLGEAEAAGQEDTPRDTPVIEAHSTDSQVLPTLAEGLEGDDRSPRSVPQPASAVAAPAEQHEAVHQHEQHVSIVEPPRSEPSPRSSDEGKHIAGGRVMNTFDSGHMTAPTAQISVASNMSMSEKSYLTETALDDAAGLADEVSESVMKAVPSAVVSRMPTSSTNVTPEASDAPLEPEEATQDAAPEADTLQHSGLEAVKETAEPQVTDTVDPEEPSTEPTAPAIANAAGDYSQELAEAEAPEKQQVSSGGEADSAEAATDFDNDVMQQTAEIGSEHPGEVTATADEALDVLVSELSTKERSSTGETS